MFLETSAFWHFGVTTFTPAWNLGPIRVHQCGAKQGGNVVTEKTLPPPVAQPKCRQCARHCEASSLHGPVAQRLEQATHNRLVLGSNPSGPTTLPHEHPPLGVPALAGPASGAGHSRDRLKLKPGLRTNGRLGSGVQSAKFSFGHPLPIGWGKGRGEGQASGRGARCCTGGKQDLWLCLERKAVAARTEEVGVTIARSFRRREELLKGMGATVFMT
jgi:hypothetical protein